MRKLIKILLIVILPWATNFLNAQTKVTNIGTEITVGNSRVYINGDYVNGESKLAKIDNDGSIYITNNIINNSSNHLFSSKTGKVIFNGNTNQIIRGDSSIYFNKVEVNNSKGELELAQNILVRDSLVMKAGNVNLNGKIIDLDSTGYLHGENNNRRIYGNDGTIRLRRQIRNTKLSENLGGLGIFISTKDNFSYTVIERGHKQQKFAGDTSVLRYYNVYPSYPVKIDTLKMVYLEKESIPNQNFFKVFASFDDGVEWKNKGGFVDITNNTIQSMAVSPPDFSKARFAIIPTQNFATCEPNNPSYISAVFLVSSTAIEGDSVKFVQLSQNNPTGYNWNFGDGEKSIEPSPFHTYRLMPITTSQDYSITMTVTNGTCSDTRKKTIEVIPDPKNQRKETLFYGIEYADIYPNPNMGSMNIEVRATDVADISIEIINSQGVTVQKELERTSALNTQYNLSSLASGMYYVKLRVGEDIRIMKMVKM